MPSAGLASPSFAELAQQFGQGRVEPEFGPPAASRTADGRVSADAPKDAVEMSGMFSKTDDPPELFGFAAREAPPTSEPKRRALAERLHIGSVFYLVLVGLVAAATISVFFGSAFLLLAQSKDKTFVRVGPVSPSVEGPVSTARDTTRAGDASTSIAASAETVPASDPPSGSPSPLAPPPPVSPNSAAAELVAPLGESTHSESAARRSIAHSAAPRGRSAYRHRRPSRGLVGQAEKQRMLSAAMDRAHHENFSDPFQSLTPPQTWARNPFDQLITRLTGQTKPARSLTPP